MTARTKIAILVLLLALAVLGWSEPALSQSPFVFVVTNDQRQYTGPGIYDTCEYYRGACEAIDTVGEGVFMLVPGDLDPTVDTEWTIADVLGSDYLWYPVVGNHELPGQGTEAFYGANIAWLRGYDYDANGTGNPPDIVNTGPSGCPETTFSFDYENAHFAVLNEYCDVGGDTVTYGDIPDHLYDWLVADLAATSQPLVFVIGHEPAYPQPDEYNGRLRHQFDSLNQYPANRDRFWDLLVAEGVTAYICGHTHNYSAVRIDENGVIGENGVWQIDAGHARGIGDTGAPSTFVRVVVDGSQVTFQTYRTIPETGPVDYCEYNLIDEWTTGPTAVSLTSFTADWEGERVLVAWETALEIDTVGFDLWRSTNPTEGYVQINDALIPAVSPGGVSGGSYSYKDSAVTPETAYYYKLEELEVGGTRNWYGPVSTGGEGPTAATLLFSTVENLGGAWWLPALAVVVLSVALARFLRRCR